MKLRNIQDWHVTPKYGAGSKLFTVKIHHGGEFIEIPRKIYMGGEFDYIDFCNDEEFSLSSFGLFAKILGYKDHLGFYYLLPKTSLRDGLVFILTEGDVQRMKDIALANGEIDIYVVETSHEDSQINKNIDENTDKHTESDQEEYSYEDKSLYDTDYDQSEDDVLEVESPNGNLNQATPLAQVEPRKKKRCSVCLKEGHYRNTCPTATGRMWQNMDFYGYNCQKNPTRVPSVARNLNAPSSIGMNEIGETEMSALAPSMSSFTVSNPPTPSGTSISVHEPAQGLNLGGVSMKANFKKGGKNCVTLSTLEYAARSRMLKESNARDIGHLSQQSSTAK